MAGFFYYGEQSGARIIRGNVGTTQVTSGDTEQVLMHGKTWDLQPAGPVGDNVFRDANLNIKTNNGYAFTVTPVVDEVTQEAQAFNGAGAVSASAQATVAERGNRIAVEFEETARTGDVEVEDVTVSFKPIRSTP